MVRWPVQHGDCEIAAYVREGGVDLPGAAADAVRMPGFKSLLSDSDIDAVLAFFMAAYQTNREVANEVAIEASPIAALLLDLLVREGDFEGTAGDLLKMINGRADPNAMRKRGWPQTPSHLSGLLKRLAPNLRSSDVEIDWFRSAGRRFIRISRKLSRESGVQAVQAVQGVHDWDEAEVDLDGAYGDDGDLDATADDPMLRAAIDSGACPAGCAGD